MENIVLTIGGLIKNFNMSDLFFFSSILILILLLIYIVFLIRTEEEDNKGVKLNDIKSDKPKNIEDIITSIEKNYEPKPIDLSKYEQEMEDTAVISYEELKNRVSNSISYDDNYDSGTSEIDIKKIDDTKMSETKEIVKLPENKMTDYESEEAFVKSLKTLQNNLIR